MARFTYIVRQGDTLSKIANSFDSSVEQILNDNALIENPNFIFVGQPLIITGTENTNIHSELSELENTNDEPLWLKIARREIGQREVVGSSHNMRIIEYLQSCEKLDASAQKKDETAWCSAFVNWVMEQSGIQGTDSAWALDWRGWGNAKNTPKLGAIAVFSRDAGGHVGFLIEDKGTKIRLLGGNQSNSVKISTYPKDGTLGGMRYKFKGYRWPS